MKPRTLYDSGNRRLSTAPATVWIIETRYLGQWSQETLGDEHRYCYVSEDVADEIIESLRQCGPDWAEAEFRAREIRHTEADPAVAAAAATYADAQAAYAANDTAAAAAAVNAAATAVNAAYAAAAAAEVSRDS